MIERLVNETGRWHDFMYDSDQCREEGHTVDCECWICEYRQEYRADWHDRDGDPLYRYSEMFNFYHYKFTKDAEWSCTGLCAAIKRAFDASCNDCELPF
jgi:hypothetical protein